MNTFTAVDGIVVAAYFLVMLAIGLHAMRANRNAREYFAGGNRIPWWVSGMTMYMANFSAWTFSGAAGFAYETGWFALVYFAIWPVAYLAGTLMTATRWRRTRSVSPVEYTRTRFTPLTQQLLSWVLGTNFLLTAGVQLAAVCTLLGPLTGIPLIPFVIGTGLVILAYTFFGGIWAVSITDVVQGIILLSITVLLLPLAVWMAGGFDRVLAAVPPIAFSHEYQSVHYDALWLVSIFIIMTVGVAAGQAQRFYSVRDERAARRTGVFAAALFITAPVIFGIPPLAARAIWPDLTAVPFFAQAGGNPRDLVFLALCLSVLPAGLIGFFAAAMLAATMSTLSSVFNMIAAIVAKDVYQGALRPNADDAAVYRIGRGATAGIGLVVTVLAIVFITSPGGIFNAMQALSTLFNIPIVVPIALGLIIRSAPRRAALAALAIGLASGAAARWLLGWDYGTQALLQAGMTGGVFVLTARMPALLGAQRAEDQRTLDAFFTRLDTPVDAAAEIPHDDGRFEPVAVAGTVTLILAAFVALLAIPSGTLRDRSIVVVLAALLATAGFLLRRASRGRS